MAAASDMFNNLFVRRPDKKKRENMSEKESRREGGENPNYEEFEIQIEWGFEIKIGGIQNQNCKGGGGFQSQNGGRVKNRMGEGRRVWETTTIERGVGFGKQIGGREGF